MVRIPTGSPFKLWPPYFWQGKMLRSTLSAAVFLFGLVQATLLGQHWVSPLHSSEISFYLSFANFSAAAYCQPSKTISWDCGGIKSISLNKSVCFLTTFKPSVMRIVISNPWHLVGMGRISHSVRDYSFPSPVPIVSQSIGYVGYSPKQRTVIVAHHGSDVRQL